MHRSDTETNRVHAHAPEDLTQATRHRTQPPLIRQRLMDGLTQLKGNESKSRMHIRLRHNNITVVPNLAVAEYQNASSMFRSCYPLFMHRHCYLSSYFSFPYCIGDSVGAPQSYRLGGLICDPIQEVLRSPVDGQHHERRIAVRMQRARFRDRGVGEAGARLD